MLDAMKSIVLAANRFAYALGAIAVGMMMLQTTVHAVLQFAFSYPLPGTIFFISNYYMVVVTFLCIGAVQLRDGHISVDLVTNMLPPRIQRILAGFVYLVSMVVFGALAWQGYIIANSRRLAGTFELEYDIKFFIWPSYYLVPIGSALMVLTLVLQLIHVLAGKAGDQTAPQAAKRD